MATKEEVNKIKSDYTINEFGLIKNPGKFENEPVSTVYFYSGMLDGWTDEVDCIALDESDHKEFDIDENYKYAHIYEDSNGFVYCEFLTEDEYYSLAFNTDESEEE